MTKIIFVLVDGLDVASKEHMSYLAAHNEQGAINGILHCELPTTSRPIYATLFTGKSPLQNNITFNGNGLLNEQAFQKSLFYKLYLQGQSCAMAAYYWMREIYSNEVYEVQKHRLNINLDGPITYGIFYNNDDYPDEYVFQDAQSLKTIYNPDFLLVHSMGVDAAGHAHGAMSTQYRNAVRKVDYLLAEYVPTWLEQGSVVIITSDHGMHADGAHNDIKAEVRCVPYWILGTKSMIPPQSQKDWYNLLCDCYALNPL